MEYELIFDEAEKDICFAVSFKKDTILINELLKYPVKYQGIYQPMPKVCYLESESSA